MLRYLVTAAADEGNYLLNIGPRADGTVRRAEVTRLSQIGRWLKVNGQAIYGSQRCGRIMPPDPHVTVIKVRFVERPGMLRQPDRAAWLTGKA